MLNLLRHVGIVVRDVDAAIRQWTESYGLTVVERFDILAEGVRSAMPSTEEAFGEGTWIELASPTDPDDQSLPIACRLARHSESGCHLARLSDDLALTVQQLRQRQVQMLETPLADHRARAVVHPGSANGVLLELLGGTAEPTGPGDATGGDAA